HLRLRLARPAARHRPAEGADGLELALVHDHQRLGRRLRRGRVPRHQRVHPRRRPGVPHLLRRQPRRLGAGQHLELPRPGRARPPGDVGGLTRGLPAERSVRLVELARRIRPPRDGPGSDEGLVMILGMLRSDYRTGEQAGSGAWTSPRTRTTPSACPGRTRAAAMTQRPRPQTRPLDGLRVLDLSRAVSGPLAGRILADLGADVVRAELPGTDVTQAFGKVTRGRSGLYSHVNAGKRSVLLDLHRPGDVARLLDLAAACDVLVENFRPGVLDRFG